VCILRALFTEFILFSLKTVLLKKSREFKDNNQLIKLLAIDLRG
jgi:hypothetical protein